MTRFLGVGQIWENAYVGGVVVLLRRRPSPSRPDGWEEWDTIDLTRGREHVWFVHPYQHWQRIL